MTDSRALPLPLAAAAALLLGGCVWHGPRVSTRLAPERHPLAGKQLSLTVAGRRPATPRVVHRARLNHGAVRRHAPPAEVAPWVGDLPDAALGVGALTAGATANAAGATARTVRAACEAAGSGFSSVARALPVPPRLPAGDPGERGP